MQRLLVATDFSAGADRALRRAMLLARQTGAALTLLHGVEPGDAGAARDAGTRLAELRDTLAEVDGILADTRVSSSELCAAIAAAAAEFSADLIVIGASTHHPLRSALTGSHTERLVRGCDHPVLVCAASPGSGYRAILAATDFSKPSQAALRAATALGLANLVDVTVAHIVETPMPSFHADSGSIREQTERWIGAERAAADLRLEALLAPLGLAAVPRVIVPNESTPARSLIAVAKDLRAELIVVGCSAGTPLKQRLLGSCLTELLMQSTVDVLVVPATSDRRSELQRGAR